MYLSELNIVGFKSFAKKTNLIFHEGVTSIVGPNGCGKSNIVDAIRWVMGEQKSGALRSERMEHVIFNGSATAKPVGMAEVSLTIENTKNILPVDYSEVVITRRLFRSGESHYLINGSQCRLKDILDLFMDTGAGSHSYSVIELAQVERLLNGKEDERRRIFEEAAGITKYKLRRKATFRKLEFTEKDLIRIEDIMSEVEKTVRSLRRQVAKAQRYQELSVELKNLEIKLANFEYAKIIDESEPLETRMNLVKTERDSASSILAQKDAEYEAMRTMLLDLDKSLSEKQRIVNEINNEIHKFEERVLVNRERIRSLEETQIRYSREKESFVLRLEQLSEQQRSLHDRVRQSENVQKQKRLDHDACNKEYENIRDNYEEKRTAIRETESQILKITEEFSRKQNEGERLRATEENIAKRIKQLDEDEEAAQERRRNLAAQIGRTSENEKKHLAMLEQKKKQLAETNRIEEDAKSFFESLQKSEAQNQNRIEVLEHQAELIKRLIDTYEDYPSGVRFLAAQEGDGFFTDGPLANIIRVDKSYRTAIAAALGEAATYLVVENPNVAFSGIVLLRDQKKGVVTFAPRTELSLRSYKRPPVSDLGIVGWADELIDCDERFNSIVYGVLGSYLIVQDLQTANRIFDELKKNQINVVTLTGEVLGHSGIIRGGMHSKNQNEIVGRQEQLTALNQEIEKLRQDSEFRRKQMAQRETEMQQAGVEAENLAKEIRAIEESMSSIRVEMGKLTFEEQTLNEARQKREWEKQRLLGEISQLGHNLEIQTLGTDDLQTTRQQLGQKAADLGEELKTMENEVNDARTRLQEFSVEVARLQSEFEALQRENDSLKRQILETEQLITARTEEAEKAAEETKELVRINETYSEEIEILKAKRKGAQEKLNELEDKQYELNTKIAEQEKLIRLARQEVDKLSESVHQTELRVSELKLRADNLRSKMRIEFEYELIKQPIDPDFVPDESKERIEVLRERIKAAGPVNLLALKEYEQEKERLDFLQTQRDDLIKARKNLTETIDIINTTARKNFLETFELVQQYFADVFSTFFEGGRASLVLQETADPLEAEIEILATPGGKKPSVLSLLSGGEKSLTAISLLFAIYLVKPSPFCIFDEVDAPLDDQNIRRFTNALKEFASNTQFIMVTHNKLTMRAADQLYGITMEEKGISKVVSVKFDSARNDQLVPQSEAEETV